MHLLLVAGFLGSGKTTLIVPLAKSLVQRGHRVAILVNEIGEIGIDDQLMRQLDLNVWELLSGCICCTLSADLVSTLRKLDADYSPDLVIVEPSGIADPRLVLAALPYYREKPLQSVRSAVLLDPTRLAVLLEVMTPLTTSQIQQADVLIVNKVDVASAEELDEARRAAREINPRARLVCTAVKDGVGEELIAELVPWLS